MTNYYNIIIIVFITIGIFTILGQIGDHIKDNGNLDSSSVNLINSINYQLNSDFNESQFSEATNNTGSFEGQDAFTRQFLESKSEAQKKTSIVQRIIKIPDLILLSIGIPDNVIDPLKWIISSFILLILSFATYRAFFGGGKVTKT